MHTSNITIDDYIQFHSAELGAPPPPPARDARSAGSTLPVANLDRVALWLPQKSLPTLAPPIKLRSHQQLMVQVLGL